LFSILRTVWATRLTELRLWNLARAFRHSTRHVLQTERVSKRNIEDRYLRVYLWLMPGVRKCVRWLRLRREHARARRRVARKDGNVVESSTNSNTSSTHTSIRIRACNTLRLRLHIGRSFSYRRPRLHRLELSISLTCAEFCKSQQLNQWRLMKRFSRTIEREISRNSACQKCQMILFIQQSNDSWQKRCTIGVYGASILILPAACLLPEMHWR